MYAFIKHSKKTCLLLLVPLHCLLTITNQTNRFKLNKHHSISICVFVFTGTCFEEDGRVINSPFDDAQHFVFIFRSLYGSKFMVLLTLCVYMYSRYTRRNLAVVVVVFIVRSETLILFYFTR